MARVLVTSRKFGVTDPRPRDMLIAAGLELVERPCGETTLTEEQLVSVVGDVDAAIVGDDCFTARVMEEAPRLKLIAKYGVGVDRIDVTAASRKGIAVTNAPGSNSRAVADFTLGLIISLARRIAPAQECVRRGEWQGLTGSELHHKVLGIVGLGRIGQEVAKRARGFDMDIRAYDPYPDSGFADRLGVALAGADTVVAEADFLTLHLPLLPETRNFLGAGRLSLMKPTACVINAARGEVVDEMALADALRNGKLAGAAVDTLATEPPDTRHPLIAMDNAIVTPHMAAHTYEANLQAAMTSAHNVLAVLRGEHPTHLVTPEGHAQ